MSVSFLRLPAVCVALALLGACVSYRPLGVSVPRAEASLPAAPTGPLAFDDAVRLLVHRHPDLCADRAEILAVNTHPGPNPVVGRLAVNDGDATDLTLETDLLSLFGVGPRAAATATAKAIQGERVLRYFERGRDLVAALAEAYAVERVLRDLEAPGPALDLAAFRAAGLASEASLRAATAALAEADAEGRVLASALAEARRRIVELTGALPGEAPGIEPVAPAWPAIPEATDGALVRSRGDLQRLFGAYQVSDRRFREAVVRQYPNLELRLGGNLKLDTPLQLIRLRLPMDADDQARAASWSRRAAYQRLRGGVLAARHDAVSRRLTWTSAAADVDAADSRRDAADALFEAEQARVETDASAFASLVLIVGSEVAAARGQRRAAVAEARARVRAARAAGWPSRARITRTNAKEGAGS